MVCLPVVKMCAMIFMGNAMKNANSGIKPEDRTKLQHP